MPRSKTYEFGVQLAQEAPELLRWMRERKQARIAFAKMLDEKLRGAKVVRRCRQDGIDKAVWVMLFIKTNSIYSEGGYRNRFCLKVTGIAFKQGQVQYPDEKHVTDYTITVEAKENRWEFDPAIRFSLLVDPPSEEQICAYLTSSIREIRAFGQYWHDRLQHA